MDGMGSIILFNNGPALAAVAVVAIASTAQRGVTVFHAFSRISS